LDGESALCDGLGLFRRNDLEPGIVDVIDDAPHAGAARSAPPQMASSHAARSA
jgi:hypothetical protein